MTAYAKHAMSYLATVQLVKVVMEPQFSKVDKIVFRPVHLINMEMKLEIMNVKIVKTVAKLVLQVATVLVILVIKLAITPIFSE